VDLSPGPDELVATIARHLEIDWQYIEHVEAWDAERIAAVRSAGRKAGRLLKYRIVTMQTDSRRREDGRVVVVVAVREPPSVEEGERMGERSRLLIDETFKNFG
jgi:hypothetical protein